MVVKDGESTVAGKVLIVDDVATNRIVLKVKLTAAFYDTFQAADGAEAIQMARSARPDLILLDIELPDMSGIEVCRALKADRATADIPIIVITAFPDADRRLEALTAGAEDVLWKPIDDLVLLARMRSLLRARETQENFGLANGAYDGLEFAETAAGYAPPGVIGLVAGRIETAISWKRALMPFMSERLQVLDRDAALSDFTAGQVPDVFVVAADMPRTGDGLRFMSELRSRPATRNSAICLIVGDDARDTLATALDLGANDLIAAGADPAETALRIRNQLRRKRHVDGLRSTVADGLRMAMIDPLTGLHNRRFALPYVARLASGEARVERPFAVLLIDLDRFKSVNDTYGHAAGDAVLTTVATRLRETLRAEDLIARIGGEEFLVALPGIDFLQARHTAERLRRAVCEQPVALPSGAPIHITLSIGLTMGGTGTATPETADQLIARADQALLTAKADGRNQVIVGRSAA